MKWKEEVKTKGKRNKTLTFEEEGPPLSEGGQKQMSWGLSQLSPAQPRANLTDIQNSRSCTCRGTWGISYSTASQTPASSRRHHQRPDSSGWDTLYIAFLGPRNKYRFREKSKWKRFPDSSGLVNPAPLSDPNSEPSFSSACIPRDNTGGEHQSHERERFLDHICFETGISRLINNKPQNSKLQLTTNDAGFRYSFHS